MTLFRLARRSLLLWFGAGFLCVGIILLATGLRDAARERRFQQAGVSVSAVVVSKSIVRASRQGSTTTKYEIAYRFVTEDRRAVEGVDVVDVEEWERLEPGRPFTVTYLPASPESSRAQGSGGMASALIMAALGSVFTLVGGTLFVVTGRRVLRGWRILRTGQAARGSVIAIRPTNVSVNRRRQWEIRYRYDDHLGRAHEGTSGSLPPREVEAFAVGDAIDVRFDRARPEHSIWGPPAAAPAGAAASHRPLKSLWIWARNVATMLAIVFVALVVGEAMPAFKTLDHVIARHEGPLLALTITMTFIGFALFMGGILHRIFFGGGGTPMSHADVEDLSRSVRESPGPAVARASAYRFRGRSAASSFNEQFTVKEAKAAWRGRAWRTSGRWRSNFVVMAGVLIFTVGLFGIFAVTGPAGIKLLVGAVITYAAVRTIGAFARA